MKVNVVKTEQIPTEMLPVSMQDAFRRYSEFMPSNDDIVTFVLKAHLILERALFDLVVTLGNNDIFFDKKHLKNSKFNALLRLAKALDGGKTGIAIWESLFKINQLRDRLAHKLELMPSDIRTEMDKISDGYLSISMPEVRKDALPIHPHIYLVWILNITLATRTGERDLFGKDGLFSKVNK